MEIIVDLINGTLIGLATTLLGTYVVVKTYTRQQTKDLVEKVKKDTELHMKLDFISNKLIEGNAESRMQFEKINSTLKDHEIRIVTVENQLKER